MLWIFFLPYKCYFLQTLKYTFLDDLIKEGVQVIYLWDFTHNFFQHMEKLNYF